MDSRSFFALHAANEDLLGGNREKGITGGSDLLTLRNSRQDVPTNP